MFSQQAGQGSKADYTLMSMSVTLRSRLEIFLQTHKVAVLNTLRRQSLAVMLLSLLP